MKILPEKNIDRTEWSMLVQTSVTGTWFQTPEAYDFFSSQPESLRPFAFGLINDQSPINNHQSQLRAVCVGYVTMEKSSLKQFFTRRAIIIGGPCLADDCTNEEVETLMNAVRIYLSSSHPAFNSPIYIETRNFNDYSRWRSALERAGFNYQQHLNFHVDTTDKKAMWERLSDNRKRQIKKAQVEGVEITEAQAEQEIEEWYGILQKLYKTKVKTPLFPLTFFMNFLKQGIGKYLLVKYQGKIIGGSMLIMQSGKAVYEWFECGLNHEYKDQYPSVMATWAGMNYAYAHGVARYDMMGAGIPKIPYGVRDFKVEFGGNLVEHGRFFSIEKSVLYKIGVIGLIIIRRIL